MAIDVSGHECRCIETGISYVKSARMLQVTRVDSTAAIEEQFGAQPSSGRGMVPGFNNSLGARVARTSSAYMLV